MQMDIQWLLAALAATFLIGLFIGLIGKNKKVCKAIESVSGFLDTIRGGKHTPIDNLRFLTQHLQEGGPEEWTKLFGKLENLNIEKAKTLLDGMLHEDSIGNLK